MSAPRRPAPAAPEPPDRLAVAVGPRVVELLDLAYRARRPVLLEGPTGIGKSQIVAEFARSAGLSVMVLDLSLLEPPDLIGLPVIEGDRTRYAAPAELPTGGRGVLMLEELNRAEIPVMQPALQLLSARRLHAYELPPGWTCVAAVNPEDGNYQVNRLDPALRSRFLQLSVRADREAWLAWAVRANVHPILARLVRDHEDAFAQASPRCWAYASDLLHALRPEELKNADLLRLALRGYLPTAWALAAVEALAAYPATPALDPDVLFAPAGEAELARIVRDFESRKRGDAVVLIASRLRRLLGEDAFAERVRRGDVTLVSLERLLACLPGDLRDQCLDGAADSPAGPALLRGLGHDPAALVESYARSPLRAELAGWRRDMKLHRVRLVVAAVAKALDGRALDANLEALIEDAGPLAERLRARGPA